MSLAILSKNRSNQNPDISCRDPGRQLFDVPLAQRLGYEFRDTALLKQALTHPSMGEGNNQRLEFLGDAVLELCASQALYTQPPALDEGQMTRLRAALVNETALVRIASRIGLENDILMTSECALNGGRARPSIVSSALEAVIAAIYLDGGLAAASGFFSRLWLPFDVQALRPVDDKSALQEWLQARGQAVPVYRVVAADGAAHQRRFSVEVVAGGTVLGTARGSSKKRAEQDAARQALSSLASTEGA